MELTTIAILVGSIVLATTGQVLLKAGMTEVGEVSRLDVPAAVALVGRVATTWQLLAGFVSFGASSILWLVVLSRVPLSTAYPVVSLSYLLILGVSTVVLGERPGALIWAGAALVSSGIALIGLGSR